jgi:deoxyribonuclease-1
MDNKNIKFCKNCKYHNSMINTCKHGSCVKTQKNSAFLVNGEEFKTINTCCENARKNEELCGKEGRFFEKLTKKDTQSKFQKIVTKFIEILSKGFIAILLVIAFLTVQENFNNLKAATPSSFHKAKKLLYTKVYNNSGNTFYCGCDWDNKKVNLNSCNYKIRKNKKRAMRTEAEHIVPAYYLAMLTAEGRACWKEGTRLKGTNGRKYCLATNPTFKQAHNDLMNLVPTIGEVNGDRSNYKFGMIAGEFSNYGSCDMEVSRKSKKVEPPKNVRGDIARTYFYMRDRYNLNLSKQTTQLMNAWNKQDPMSNEEKQRIDKVNRLQR